MEKYGVVIRVPDDNKCPGCGADLQKSDDAGSTTTCPVHGTKYLEVSGEDTKPGVKTPERT